MPKERWRLRLPPDLVDAEREARERTEEILPRECTEKEIGQEARREGEEAWVEGSSRLEHVAEAGFAKGRRLLRELPTEEVRPA